MIYFLMDSEHPKNLGYYYGAIKTKKTEVEIETLIQKYYDDALGDCLCDFLVKQEGIDYFDFTIIKV